MMSNLGNFIDQKTSVIPEDCDLPNLLDLFLMIVRSQSFVVSIPVLVTWTRLLRSEDIGGSPTVNPLVAPLLEVCSSRLVRYEHLPEDSDDPSLIFLLEDIDTIPERHAFLGNYRRYSVQVIEYIVRWKQSDAIYHILSQAGHTLAQLYDESGSFAGRSTFAVDTPSLTIIAGNYSKTSMSILKVEAQFTVVEAALKSYMKWRSSRKTPSAEHVSFLPILPPDTSTKYSRNNKEQAWRQISRSGVISC
jgi:exportin-5